MAALSTAAGRMRSRASAMLIGSPTRCETSSAMTSAMHARDQRGQDRIDPHQTPEQDAAAGDERPTRGAVASGRLPSGAATSRFAVRPRDEGPDQALREAEDRVTSDDRHEQEVGIDAGDLDHRREAGVDDADEDGEEDAGVGDDPSSRNSTRMGGSAEYTRRRERSDPAAKLSTMFHVKHREMGPQRSRR